MGGKGAGGGTNCCTSCSGKGFKTKSVQRVIPASETRDGKPKVVSEQVREDCVKCGGTGNP